MCHFDGDDVDQNPILTAQAEILLNQLIVQCLSFAFILSFRNGY